MFAKVVFGSETVMKIISSTVKFILFTLVCLLLVFLLAALIWIIITPYETDDFFYVLSIILKRAGAYSTLLVGIVITIFVQIYTKEKELENEEKIKVSEIGYYTLAFPNTDNSCNQEYDGNRIVVEIETEGDYKFNPFKESKNKYHFTASFETSKKQNANLKNVMAFGDQYFIENKSKILRKYFEICEKTDFSSPSYCTAMPTTDNGLLTKFKESNLFWLVLNNSCQEPEIFTFWISAITEEGILLLIKVKASAKNAGNNLLKAQLLQQTTYYRRKNKLIPLYR